jgi:hypothetical protein
MVEKSHTALGWTVNSSSYQILSPWKVWKLNFEFVQVVNSSKAVPQPTKLLSVSPRGGIQFLVCPYFDPHHFYLWETMNDGVYAGTHILCKNIWREIFNISRQKLSHMKKHVRNVSRLHGSWTAGDKQIPTFLANAAFVCDKSYVTASMLRVIISWIRVYSAYMQVHATKERSEKKEHQYRVHVYCNQLMLPKS